MVGGRSNEGHKTGTKLAGTLRFGYAGKGIELAPEFRRKNLEYNGKEISFFVNHKGLYDLGVLEIRNHSGIKRLKSSDGNFYEYPIFLEYQIEYGLERGYGMITWPDSEGRPGLDSISLDLLLSLDELKIDKDLIKVGLDDKTINEILKLLRDFKKDEESIKKYLEEKHKKEDSILSFMEYKK